MLRGHQTPSAQASVPHPPQIPPLTFPAEVVDVAGPVVDAAGPVVEAGAEALVVDTAGAPVVEVLWQDGSRHPGPVQTISQFLSITSPKFLNPGQTTSIVKEQFVDVVVETT